MSKGDMTLDDFKIQLEKMAKPGLLQQLMGFMPGMGELKNLMAGEDTEGGIKQAVGINQAVRVDELTRFIARTGW